MVVLLCHDRDSVSASALCLATVGLPSPRLALAHCLTKTLVANDPSVGEPLTARGVASLRHVCGWAVAKETEACTDARPLIGQWQR